MNTRARLWRGDLPGRTAANLPGVTAPDKPTVEASRTTNIRCGTNFD